MEKQPQFPAEEVSLPSKGLLYPKDSPLNKGFIEMKYMTAREEDILTNPNFIKKGNVIDEQQLEKCNEVVVILKCSNVEICDNNLRLNWEVQQIAGVKRKKKIKVDKTFKIRKDN